ncbi:hypothetical protein Plec18167_000815 [Paecilomyces lecythidis]|uniref:Uncharacterized protein n=1 Tax=Paecilomyces lecythidis TaxID=3004212 RepID=A0ABR3YFR6_9EURO
MANQNENSAPNEIGYGDFFLAGPTYISYTASAQGQVQRAIRRGRGGRIWRGNSARSILSRHQPYQQNENQGQDQHQHQHQNQSHSHSQRWGGMSRQSRRRPLDEWSVSELTQEMQRLAAARENHLQQAQHAQERLNELRNFIRATAMSGGTPATSTAEYRESTDHISRKGDNTEGQMVVKQESDHEP